MPAKRYFVNLTQEEKEELKALISSGKSKARVQTRARVLLLCVNFTPILPPLSLFAFH